MLIRFYQPFQHSGSILLSRVHKALTPTEFPPSSQDLNDVLALYVKGNNSPLLDKKSDGFRNEGIHYVNFGSPITFWPPPLIGPEHESSSVCWECEVLDEDIYQVFDGEKVCSAVGVDKAMFYRRYFW